MTDKVPCPVCGSAEASVVVDSRPTALGVRRRRKCNKCLQRFTTIEVSVPERSGWARLAQRFIDLSTQASCNAQHEHAE